MSERIYIDRTTTWHAIGKSVAECKDVGQVLKTSGLDYEVTKKPVYHFVGDAIRYDNGYTDIPNRFATVNSNGKVYDVVSDKFEVIQNREAFDFVSYMGDELQFEKAGETKNGMVYVIAKLPKVSILGDAFVPHVIFRNGFSGKVKITAAICPLRVVCQNQFNFAFDHADNAVAIRHVQNAEAKLQEAREVLRLSANYMSSVSAMAQQFVTVKMDDAKLARVLDWLFPIPEIGIDSMNAFKRNRLEVARSEFASAYMADDNSNFRGTAWGAINAYTDYVTHKLPTGNSGTKDEGRFTRVTFSNSMNGILAAIQAAG